MPDTITHIETVSQPIEVSVKVGMEIDSKGQKKPSVEIKTTHRLSLEDAKDINFITDQMVTGSLARCKGAIHKAMED